MKPHASVARKLQTLRAAGRSMTALSFPVMGTSLTGKQLMDFITQTLGMPENDDIAAMNEVIIREVGKPIVLPGLIAHQLEAASASPDDISLARHIGFDPLHLLSFASDGIARLEEDTRTYRSIARYDDGRITCLEVAFTLGKGVSWRNGRFTARGAGLPNTICASLPGRTMDTVVDHDWPGWAGIEITEAWTTGGMLTIKTITREAVPLLSA